ncbi:hypothetical protein BB561_004578 [Smittium simulii]|uniref:rRNA biogenesis protein RRP36 n=1 Tax=Smittium simulii TaxID=133385 RepID=A0A2T9YFE1_9FUNG|nr:hypothetical protein BB561_004578 [Smittium simulii]
MGVQHGVAPTKFLYNSEQSKKIFPKQSAQKNSESDNSYSQSSDSEEGNYSDFDSEAENQSDTELLDSKKAELKSELSKLSFEQILELKKKVGSKEFDKIFKNDSSAKNTDDSQSLSSTNNYPAKAKKIGNAQKFKENKKKSKKEPSEISSKKRVKSVWQIMDPAGNKPLDPRFEKSSGHLNLDLFKKSYSFIDKYQDSEIQTSRRHAEEYQGKLDEIKKMHKKREYDLIKQGKKPYFLKRSSLKEIELAKKFEQVSGTKKLDKMLEKKRKRNAAKEHKQMPYKRRSTAEE